MPYMDPDAGYGLAKRLSQFTKALQLLDAKEEPASAKRSSKGERTEEPRFRVVRRSSTPNSRRCEVDEERTSAGDRGQRQRRSSTPMRHERSSRDLAPEPGSCVSLLNGEGGPAVQVLKARSLSNVVLGPTEPSSDDVPPSVRQASGTLPLPLTARRGSTNCLQEPGLLNVFNADSLPNDALFARQASASSPDSSHNPNGPAAHAPRPSAVARDSGVSEEWWTQQQELFLANQERHERRQHQLLLESRRLERERLALEYERQEREKHQKALRFERELEAERRQAQQDRMQAHPRDVLQPESQRSQRSSLNSNSDSRIHLVSAMRTQSSMQEREVLGTQRSGSGTLPTYTSYHPQQMRAAQSSSGAASSSKQTYDAAMQAWKAQSLQRQIQIQQEARNKAKMLRDHD